MSGTHDDLRERLVEISDLLGDRILTLLSDAVSEGATTRPPQERVLTRARGAVDKAVHLLEQLTDDDLST